ncbi:hypothetical protein HUW51_12700 [Adhaeribacter swui]|uniref:LVIVD repeat-containing protein n=1 Tax=Adhaeribacter swui TaxID=2086471 RepID=A0A7G7GF92_9BACT|nr:hypothetical protein HUW51_12700 [Adhaeribacter swui]
MAAAIQSEPAKALRKTGKIYAVDQYILVNELNEGIHVIDNSNPRNPQNIGFIAIPGNVDMAVRSNVLYADAGTDLLVLDITIPKAIKVIKHLENVFQPASLMAANGAFINADPSKGIVVAYKERLVTEQRSCDEMIPNRRPVAWWEWNSANPNSNFVSNDAGKANSGGATGKAGSMARFTLYGNFLYTVGPSQMQVFNVANPTNPQKGEPVYLGGGIETIFPYQNKLFIGSNAGMLIYSLANPAAPTHIGGYSHLRACDPVVVEGNYAYVTLRTNPNSFCGGNANQLDVVDISNAALPQVRKTYPMQNPHGLGIDKSTLFICEGNYGLKVFNAANPDAIADNLLAHKKDLHAFDVIPLGKNLLVIGEDGFRQYDYSNPKSLQFLSKIPVSPN